VNTPIPKRTIMVTIMDMATVMTITIMTITIMTITRI